MSLTIPLYCYLGYNNPNGSLQVINDFNYDVLNVKSRADVAEVLRQFILKEKEKGLNALSKIHPDRQLILDNPDQIQAAMSADGVTDVASAEAQTMSLKPSSVKTDNCYTPLIIGCIISASLFVSAAIIATRKN